MKRHFIVIELLDPTEYARVRRVLNHLFDSPSEWDGPIPRVAISTRETGTLGELGKRRPGVVAFEAGYTVERRHEGWRVFRPGSQMVANESHESERDAWLRADALAADE